MESVSQRRLCVPKGKQKALSHNNHIFRGASLLLLCRNVEKMSSSASKIREISPDASIHEIQVDLADVKKVSNAVKEIKEKELMNHKL